MESAPRGRVVWAASYSLVVPASRLGLDCRTEPLMWLDSDLQLVAGCLTDPPAAPVSLPSSRGLGRVLRTIPRVPPRGLLSCGSPPGQCRGRSRAEVAFPVHSGPSRLPDAALSPTTPSAPPQLPRPTAIPFLQGGLMVNTLRFPFLCVALATAPRGPSLPCGASSPSCWWATSAFVHRKPFILSGFYKFLS